MSTNANAKRYPCRVCGVLSKHVYCGAHHPEKAVRRQQHADRAAAYRSKVLRR